jgi:hypothetical protein
MSDSESLLLRGELEIIGRLVDASNATLLAKVSLDGNESKVIYKPVAGERPLWDFETGTLAYRERAAYLVSVAAGFGVVPETILREGPFGYGAVQVWVEVDENIDLIAFGQSEHKSLRLIALFDAVVNNTDRKFGHILVSDQGGVFGCDHGVTFHKDEKLRTVIWQFSGSDLTSDELDHLSVLREWLVQPNELTSLLTELEIEATKIRVEKLLTTAKFPLPSPNWPAVPWPPV